jgi:hypothetical protein
MRSKVVFSGDQKNNHEIESRFSGDQKNDHEFKSFLFRRSKVSIKFAIFSGDQNFDQAIESIFFYFPSPEQFVSRTCNHEIKSISIF